MRAENAQLSGRCGALEDALAKERARSSALEGRLLKAQSEITLLKLSKAKDKRMLDMMQAEKRKVDLLLIAAERAFDKATVRLETDTKRCSKYKAALTRQGKPSLTTEDWPH